MLPRVAHHIAHLPIRTSGSFAGSLAHADPAFEWSLWIEGGRIAEPRVGIGGARRARQQVKRSIRPRGADYRRDLVRAMVERAMAQACG